MNRNAISLGVFILSCLFLGQSENLRAENAAPTKTSLSNDYDAFRLFSFDEEEVFYGTSKGSVSHKKPLLNPRFLRKHIPGIVIVSESKVFAKG